ncbi:hypothetical protein GOBAR_AA12543 [Gossypium barbadense]|uniref:Uncharacterized protein n=1 Tax=Gossypium barbadense TaxID=3634 RepID=A0A2P5XXN5_GOSBA|nr:hypothetical protein GOBAR_AA12543 [Gossypium barbadense]
MPVLFGRVGAHCHVAQLCSASFASSTPVYGCPRPCYFISFELDHGRVAQSLQLITTRIKEDCALFSHGCIARLCLLSWCEYSLRHACVSGRVD